MKAGRRRCRNSCRLLAVTFAIAAGVVLFAPPPARAADVGHEASPELPPPAPELLAEPDIAPLLDPLYDRYLASKEQLQSRYNIEYSLQLSVLPQWGPPQGGAPVVDFVWTPTAVWKPFSGTAWGSGTFTFYAQQNQYWSDANTPKMQARLGLLTPPSDWGGDAVDYAQLTYTHTLPGSWQWLSATVGQYPFSLYDANPYAGDGQRNFVNYALAQNATQTYGSAGFGGYLEAAAADRNLVLAGGLQSAANATGASITAQGLAAGKLAYFLAARWTPTLLAGGSYDLLWYTEPALPEDELSASRGLSFSAAQNLNAQWGLFVRVNAASGTSSTIANSVACGVIRNDLFGRDPLDQFGLGIARNATNRAAVTAPARGSEWLAEAYYDYTVFKGMQLAPDVQLYFAPALAPTAGAVAILTLRATVTF